MLRGIEEDGYDDEEEEIPRELLEEELEDAHVVDYEEEETEENTVREVNIDGSSESEDELRERHV